MIRKIFQEMLKEDCNQRFLIAVSGGPDSMALLGLCVMNKLLIEVAHVNYHKRDSAKRDRDIVYDYCKQHCINFHELDAKYDDDGNFQQWARDVRYDFFVSIAKKINASMVLVAHHRDDVLETYLMSKSRNSVPEVYGIAEEMVRDGIIIKRPLLYATKQMCIDFCHEFSIPYGIDESNETLMYTRNKIRHTILDVMSEEEKDVLWHEILTKNSEKIEVKKIIECCVVNNCLLLEQYFLYDDDIRVVILRYFLKWNDCKEAYHSIKSIVQLDNLMRHRNYISLHQKIIVKKGSVCEIVGNCNKSYSVEAQWLHAFNHDYFSLSFSGEMINAVTVTEDDFPLTIRSPLPGDAIVLRFGTKKLNRWFIDRKIPRYERETWPVVVNRHQEVILVPQIGCNITHYTVNPNCFVLKY